MSNADKLFEELGYCKIHCAEGFFFYNADKDKAVMFNLSKKTWRVYDYETGKTRGYGDELLKAILKKELEMKWLTQKEYELEMESVV